MANRIVSGLGWTTASSVVRNLVSLLQIAVLTRFLAKSDFGIIAIANLFVSFTSMFLDMGMSAGIIHKQNISKKEYASLFWLNIMFGVGLTGILYIIAPILTSQYDSPDLTKIVRLICFTIFLSSLGTLSRTFSQKTAMFKRMAIIETIGHLIVFAVVIIAAAKGCGAYSLAYSSLAGSIIINLTYLILAVFKDKQVSFHFAFTDTLPFLKIGIYQVGSSILDFFTRELDIIIVSATLGLEFLGVYNIAKRIPVALYSFVSPIVSRVFTPLLAEMNGNVDRIKTNYIKLSKALSWVSFPMYLLLAALSPTVISIVFGVDYLAGVPVMMAFCLRYAFNGVNQVCGSLQVALGRTDIGLKWTIYLIASTAVVYYGTSLLGVNAFLCGICALTFINAFVCWIMQFKPMAKVSFAEYVTIYSRSFIICTVLAVAVYIIYPHSSLLYSVCASIVFAPLFVILLLKSKDGREVIEVLEQFKVPYKAISVAKKIHG